MMLFSFQSYKEWEKENGPEPRLPGIDLTHDQLLFLALGQVSSDIQAGPAIIQGVQCSSKGLEFLQSYA